jgi:hypothetical protein
VGHSSSTSQPSALPGIEASKMKSCPGATHSLVDGNLDPEIYIEVRHILTSAKHLVGLCFSGTGSGTGRWISCVVAFARGGDA